MPLLAPWHKLGRQVQSVRVKNRNGSDVQDLETQPINKRTNHFLFDHGACNKLVAAQCLCTMTARFFEKVTNPSNP